MFERFRRAIYLYANHAGLVIAIVLTVWLPGNLLLNYFVYGLYGDDPEVTGTRLAMALEFFFGPVYAGALVYAVWQIERGARVTYFAAMRFGVANWLPLLGTHLLASLWISLGLLLCVIPGVVMLLRYSFVNPVVLLEQRSGSNALKRSTELTGGWKQQLLLAGLLFYAALSGVTFAAYVPFQLTILTYVESELLLIVGMTALDCLVDILATLFSVVVMMYYLDARKKEGEIAPVEAELVDSAWQNQPPLLDDGNPYLPPHE